MCVLVTLNALSETILGLRLNLVFGVYTKFLSEMLTVFLVYKICNLLWMKIKGNRFL
jgi:hypothetical protein